MVFLGLCPIFPGGPGDQHQQPDVCGRHGLVLRLHHLRHVLHHAHALQVVSILLYIPVHHPEAASVENWNFSRYGRQITNIYKCNESGLIRLS